MDQNTTLDHYMKIAWQQVSNKYNMIAAQHGFTQAAGYILIHIHKNGTSVSQIASSTGVKATSLSRVLGNLEKTGLIYREISQEDKRSVKVFLTPYGIQKRKLAKLVVRDFNDYLYCNLSGREVAQLTKILTKITLLTEKYESKVSLEEEVLTSQS